MLFFDGAFGTYYYEKTGDNEPCERANITNPEIVLGIHKEYIVAGAGAIKTNTFGANRSVYGDDGEIRDIISAGFKIAKQAAENTNVKIFADIGYVYGNEYGEDDYKKAAEIFIENGAKNFLFETLGNYNVIKPAIELIREKVENSIIVVSFAVSQSGLLFGGLFFKSAVKEAENDVNVDIIGLNCVCGPSHIIRLVKQLGKITKPLSVMPNAGYPSVVQGRTVFYNNPKYFAERLLELKGAGVEVLGGCCGTTPEHIRLAIEQISQSGTDIRKFPAGNYSPSPLRAGKLPLKHIMVELDPPEGVDGINLVIESAKMLGERGVSTITVSDSPLAKGRADSFMVASIIRRETGMDVLPHLTCRDKNYIAIKGSLLGASYERINKVLAVTGDPVTNDSIYKKPGVFNFSSTQLVEYISGLNSELFAANPFSVGAALNVNAHNFDAELNRCIKKVGKGAEFILTQPIFSQKAVANFILAKNTLKCRLYAGILPLAGYRNAVFINNEVGGIDIPDEIIEAFRGKGKKESVEISIRCSKDVIGLVYEYADGFYIMTPLRRAELVARLIEKSFIC